MSELPSVIGLEEGRVWVASYSKEWPQLFSEERRRLLAAVGEWVLDIQHVGSTSIPGMVAKPIVDIGIAVAHYEEADVCIQPIAHLGYEYKGENGILRRHFFVRGSPVSHHLHINELGSPAWQNQILFRDYLIRHPEAAEEYALIKVALARQFPFDREAYLAGKAPFIERVLRLARDPG